MKISMEWLREYVDVPETPAKLQEDLSMKGLLVEGVTEIPGGDSILEVEITANRPDCLSHIGVAREVCALYGRPLRVPPRKRKLRARTERLSFAIEIKDAELCPRYVGLVMDGIRVGPSPEWMQRRLEAAGMRPVNNVVDITNYVLLEMGHPLHAFDLRFLKQGKIVVARAAHGQRMTTLDGETRELDSEMLLINDGEGPVAIAGVMGGLESEISAATTTVLLECAYFKPASVRRTSKKLGLSTEASYRFERGADFENLVPAIARTCYLIEKLAHGRIAGSVQDLYPWKMEPAQIQLRQDRAEPLLGVKLPDGFVESTLRRLNFRMKRRGKGAWAVTCPTYRVDMELEADLVEELARFYGYQNIPTTIPPAREAGTPSPIFELESSVRRILLSLGYSEGINLSFAAESDHQEFPPVKGERISVRNPLTEESQHLRTSLIPGLIKSARRNFNHDQYQVRLFEIGKVYGGSANGIPEERRVVGILGTGDLGDQYWKKSPEAYDYYHLKGVVEALLQGIKIHSHHIVPMTGSTWQNPADASLLMVGNKMTGVLGSLGPRLMEQYKLRQPVYLAEIEFEALMPLAFSAVQYRPLAKYPWVERDLSVVISREIPFGKIKDSVAGLRIAELTRLRLIDIYEGVKIPAGKISMTIRFTFQDREKTLTVDRVQGFSDNILTHLRNSYSAELRTL